MAEEKGFKTLDEQIGVLRQHNIIVSNETSARSILEFDNYYSRPRFLAINPEIGACNRFHRRCDCKNGAAR